MCACVRGGTQLVEELVVHCALAPCATCPPRYQLLLLLHSRHGRRDATLTPARKGIPETSQVVQELSSLSNFSYFAQDLCFNKWLKMTYDKCTAVQQMRHKSSVWSELCTVYQFDIAYISLLSPAYS